MTIQLAIVTAEVEVEKDHDGFDCYYYCCCCC